MIASKMVGCRKICLEACIRKYILKLHISIKDVSLHLEFDHGIKENGQFLAPRCAVSHVSLLLVSDGV